jgi:hypothetical protein
LFEREHHRNVALVLQSLDPRALSARSCYFGGGTAMALRYGEYRESVDIDFIVSDLAGYRELRQLLGGRRNLQPILREGIALELAREVRADQYGIRTQVRAGASVIKFEIMLEGRIELAAPSADDRVCGVTTLAPIDLAAEKLLANADRWGDDSVYSRDVVDLALMRAETKLLRAGCEKAEAAYGSAVRKSLVQAVNRLGERPGRLDECMQALAIHGVTKAQLWQAVRRVVRALGMPATPAPRRAM